MYRDLSLPYRIVGILSVFAVVLLLIGTVGAFRAEGVSPALANKDFANYWIAGKLVLSGRTADLFGPHAGYFRHMTEAFGDDYQWHNWSYPPHYLFFVWWLGFLGYKAGILLFVGTSLIGFLVAARAFLARPFDALAIVALTPFLVHNVWSAQNGFLSGALLLGALALRYDRPVAAGILLGLLTTKPQLGLLFPLLLLVERRWIMLASATITTMALVAASAWIFGINAWVGYLREVVPYQTLVMRELEGRFLNMLPSLYGALRNLGVAADPALAVHLVYGGVVALVALASFWSLPKTTDRAVVFIVATFMVTPYALSYDLGPLAAATVLVVAAAPGYRLGWMRDLGIAAAMLLPSIMMPTGYFGFPLAPIVILATLVIVLERADAAASIRTGLARPPFGRGAASG